MSQPYRKYHAAGAGWVAVVGADLAVDADGVERNQGDAGDSGHDGIPNPHDDGNELGEEEEERDEGDGDIVVGKSVEQSAHGFSLLLFLFLRRYN